MGDSRFNWFSYDKIGETNYGDRNNCRTYSKEEFKNRLNLFQFDFFEDKLRLNSNLRNMSPSGSIGSAPREISVSALSSVHDVVGFDLGTFQYDISGNAVQVYLCSVLFYINYILY